MGLVRDRWKLSFRRPSSSSSLPPPSPSQSLAAKDPPPEFLCPISGTLMVDPVILPSGETYERVCIEACRDMSLSFDLSSSLIIPNSALRSAILRWCDIADVPRPLPISLATARRLAARLHPSNSKSRTSCSMELPNESSPQTTTSSSSFHSSTSSSDEIIALETLKSKSPKSPNPPEAPLPADPLEEKFLAKLKNAQIQEQESALASLLEATRESASRRVALSSPRLLAALRSLLLSRHAAMKSTALAITVNLSLEPANKVRIVRSGAVPAIVDALHSSSPTAAREHAAGAVFSLALEEQNRTAIGVLGAVPPLLRLFCAAEERVHARLEAGMALYYLCLAEINRSKLARIAGAVKGLMAVAKVGESDLRRVAMRVMVAMVESREGKTTMLDSGVVEAAVALLKTEEKVTEEEEEMVVRILYGMSLGGLRFRGIARRAGVEEVLESMEEGEKGEMARMILRAIRGEGEREREVARILRATAAEEEEETERSGASEILVTRRRMNRDPGGGSGSNSAGF